MKILRALIKKEFFQILRDPISVIIAFLLPVVSIVIYMYGVNMDSVKVTIGIKNDDNSPEIAQLVSSFSSNNYIESICSDDMADLTRKVVRSRLKGIIVIPNDFSKKLENGQIADLGIITDGSEVNTANYLQNYAVQIAAQWLSSSKYRYTAAYPVVNPLHRCWYNQEMNGYHFVLPGSIAVTMTLIGILLTALVIAREWERGTMESLLSTNVTQMQIVLGKYIPYFILGMLAVVVNLIVCIGIFKVPFYGSYSILFLVSALFMNCSLGIGLLISSILKNQFLACQVSIAIGFLPALLLSGLVFPINSMPTILQHITRLLPPRYYITFIESEFLAGTVWSVIIKSSIFLAILGVVLFIAVYKNTDMRFKDE